MSPLSRNSLDCGVLSIFFPLDDFVQRCREMKSASADELLLEEEEKSGADEKESHLLSLLRERGACCRCVSKYGEQVAVGQVLADRESGHSKARKKPTATHAAMMTSFPKQHTPKLIFAKATDALQMDEFFLAGP